MSSPRLRGRSQSLNDQPSLLSTRQVDLRVPGFKQDLIYNGRVGDSAGFIYREFVRDMARPAFTQDAVYDLSESRIFGFKSLRIEVLSASNTKIRYRMIEPFRDR